MLTFIIGLIVTVVVFIQISSLSRRVKVLEDRLQSGAHQVATQAASQTPVRATQSAVGGYDANPAAFGGVATAHPELVSFIREQWSRGVSETAIVSALHARGWQAPVVAEAMGAAGLSASFRPASVLGSAEPSGIDAFFAWCREDWLLKVGAGLLIIAFAWFVTYAFMNNWIGPFGRIMCGLFAGAAFLTLGGWRIRTHGHQGGVFLVVGSTVVLLTVFASRAAFEYPIFSAEMALGTMFLSTLVVAVMSVRYNRPVLAHASLLLASIVPLLTVPESASAVGLFTYLMVITIGSVLIVLITGHRSLLVTSLAITATYSLPFLENGGGVDGPVLLVYAFAFAALYFLMQTTALLRQPALRTSDLIIAPGIGLFVLVWIVAVVPETWQSLLLAAWTLVFAVGSFVIARRLELPVLMYLYAGIGLAFLAAATAAELSGYSLAIAFTFEVAAVVLSAWWLWKDVRVLRAVVWLFGLPVILALPYLDPQLWRGGLPAAELVVLSGLAGVLILTGMYFLLVARRTQEKETQSVGGTLAIVGSILVYVLLWRILHVFFPDDMAVTLALATYTVSGIAAYISGHRSNITALRWYGGLLIALVVGRLLLIDVWEMAIAGRIVTFGVVGVLLMSTAFMAKQKKL